MKKNELDEGFVSPLNDYVFKCIYGEQRNIENTRGLLKTILKIPPEDYHRLTVTDPFLKRRWRKDKQGIVDLKIETASGRQIAVELQVLRYKAMRERIVYYNARNTADQMKSGHRYETLRQSISVVITNYDLLPKAPSYLSRIELRDSETGELFTDLQQYVILDLSKLPEEDDGRAVWPYLKFFKCRTKEEFEMLWKRHPEVKGPVEEYQRLSWNKRRRLLADYWEKQRRDAQAATDYAHDEGLEQGRAESRQALMEKDQALAEKDQALMENQAVITEKDREILELQRKLREMGRD
jgi:predicted transposase/invertase (TIGR01784 family)